jgi:hypothetical protein
MEASTTGKTMLRKIVREVGTLTTITTLEFSKV